METLSDKPEKPERLYFATYLQAVRNSIGSAMFRSFFVRDSATGAAVDVLDDGNKSCAFYVSSVLTLFKKLSDIHGTVKNTVADMQESGWQPVDEMQPGDVLVWEEMDFADGRYAHIGFYLGEDRAVSTSTTEKAVAEHDVHFGDQNRQVASIFRHQDWS